MIKLVEILSDIQVSITRLPTGFDVVATRNHEHIGRLQIGVDTTKRTAVALAADVDENMQRQGIGTALYIKARQELKRRGIEYLWGSLEGSGIVQIREKVFGPGNTQYFRFGKEYTAKDAIEVMDVKFGRLIAKSKV